MCYSIKFLTEKKLKYARRYGGTAEEIADLERDLDEIERVSKPAFFAFGMEHPQIPVLILQKRRQMRLMQWGLIPHWTKDAQHARQLARQTLNARFETLWEKPAFREAAKRRHCLIPVDAFYEYKHLGNKKFPYHIANKSTVTMTLAGIFDIWQTPDTQEQQHTVSIVTVPANTLLRDINGGRPAHEARMPLILSNEGAEKWLTSFEPGAIRRHIGDITAEDLDAYSVAPLLGRNGTGNTPAAPRPFAYPELQKGLWE